jgi:hypothetical protein
MDGVIPLFINASPTYPTNLGLAINLPEGAGAPELMAAMRKEVRLGLDGGTITLKWDEVASSGVKSVSDGLGAAAFMGQRVLLTISTIDTVRRRVPPEFAHTPWDDAGLESRFDALLTQVAAFGGMNLGWISLGNEVNPYLAGHPEEVAAYLRFLDHERETVHRLLPQVGVGVTITCMDAIDQPDLAEQLQKSMDVIVFTYYPLKGFKVVTPLATDRHFGFMTKIAAGRPLLLQEIGCPSDELTGSSQAVQADFVNQVFDQLDSHGDSIPLAVFFIQGDFSAKQVRDLTGYYGLAEPAFGAYLGSLGLCDAVGKPKKAWGTFAAACLKRKPID